MPSEVITVLDTAVEVAAERENAVALAKSLTLDNQAGLTDRVITLRDVIAISPYYNVPTPGSTTEERFRALVVAGDMITWGEEDLKGVKFLGAMQIICSVADEVGGATDHGYATVGYEHE